MSATLRVSQSPQILRTVRAHCRHQLPCGPASRMILSSVGWPQHVDLTAAVCAPNDRMQACAHSNTPVGLVAVPVAFLAALALYLPPCATADTSTLSGPARVVDGDTLEVGSERIRLFGIDAPETKQLCKNKSGKDYACGEEAKIALEKRVGGSPVKCEVKNKDIYGRNVSVCYGGPGGEDLNAWMVSQGEAVAYSQYSKKYVSLAQEAEASKKGIWSGEFQEPALWRKDNPRGGAKDSTLVAVQPTTEAPDKKCPIKGNISSSGEKIFHVPGGRYYDNTVIDVNDGEKWFCSEKEAEKAGWRASKA